VVTDLSGFLDKSRGANVPWANCKVFGTRIRRNIKLAECPSFGKSVFDYAPKSPGAADYAALAGEVMGTAAAPPTGAVQVVGPLKVTVEAPAAEVLELPPRKTELAQVV
jgi:chromosome partitioning protein